MSWWSPTANRVMKMAAEYEMPAGYVLETALRRGGAEDMGEPVIVFTMTHGDNHCRQRVSVFQMESYPDDSRGFIRHLIEGMLLNLFRETWPWRQAEGSR